MRWRFLPTHQALVGWGGVADRAREAFPLFCDALLDHTQRILPPALLGSDLDSAEQLHGGSGPTIDGIPENDEEDVR